MSFPWSRTLAFNKASSLAPHRLLKFGHCERSSRSNLILLGPHRALSLFLVFERLVQRFDCFGRQGGLVDGALERPQGTRHRSRIAAAPDHKQRR